MHKWLLWSLLNISTMAVCGPVFAGDVESLLPTNDFQGCSALIQQGDAIPPIATNDLQSIQTCMNSCDKLYKSLDDQGKIQDLLRGITYCRKSLNNLYFYSTTKVINDQLDQQNKQNEALQQQDFMDKVTAMIKQKQEQNSQNTQNNDLGAEANSTNTASPAPAPTPIGPPDGVKW
ncbi:MAG: hypothetical protein JSR33_13195 [Proteobacteria bacterium]|nr:hypothetical protein [Pseudomonadota bacterium]